MNQYAASLRWPQYLKYAIFAFFAFRAIQAALAGYPGVTAFIVGIIAVWELVAWSKWRQKGAQAQQVAAQQAESIARMKVWETEELTPVSAGTLVLQPGETCYLAGQASLYGPVTETHRQGGYGGVSVPIGHTGMRARVGQFASHPVTTTRMALINQGPIYLTNRRVVILGQMQMSQLPLHDIMTLEPHLDGVKVTNANGKLMAIQTGTGQLGVYLQRLLHQPLVT